LGLGLLLVSVCGFTAAGCLYFYAVIPAWCCIIIAALSASTAHEIEHDLIHQQYFKSTSAVYHFMMFMVWIIRPNTVNPYYRKGIHLTITKPQVPLKILKNVQWETVLRSMHYGY
jgi:fatty acid desaturase